jgi:hypothetical protein
VLFRSIKKHQVAPEVVSFVKANHDMVEKREGEKK